MVLVHESDTIAAISTPIGEGGISVIRVSGSRALAISSKGFKGKTDLTASASHTAHFGSFVDAKGTTIDDVIALVFRAPHSYTGEDVVEVSCHGGMLVTRKVLETMILNGARPAEAGEFTKRAFLNGKIDLAQAEAVADLIQARSERAHRASLYQLRGQLSETITALRNQLIQTISLLELELDFVEEGYEFAEKRRVSEEVREILKSLEELISSYEVGRIYRDGIRVVLAGAPNVGKSSLLNALLKQNRAIVADLPGTTRDTIEESLTIGGLMFSVTDTAGLREPENPVEAEGLRRTHEQLSNCDLLLLMFDATRAVLHEEMKRAERFISEQDAKGRACVRIINKVDLQEPNSDLIASLMDLSKSIPIVMVSAKTGRGMEDLRASLVDAVFRGRQTSLDGAITITNSRHYAALVEAKNSLELSLQSLDQRQSGELVVVDLRSALDALGRITGAVTTDEILDAVFSRFCIGK